MPCGGLTVEGEHLTELSMRLDDATRTACDLARLLRKYLKESTLQTELEKDTLRWMKKHDKIDRERIKREKEEKRRKKLKKQALKKLSRKEREALNLR